MPETPIIGLSQHGEATTRGFGPGGERTLTAPPMSVSSSTASSATAASSEMWSNASSRRGSNASSVVPDLPSAAGLAAAKEGGGVPSNAQAQAQAQAAARTVHKHASDPLARVYPKPERELDVAEALMRAPPKWTLGYWAKNARDVAVPASSTPQSAAAKKRFQDTKDELRRAQTELDARGGPR